MNQAKYNYYLQHPEELPDYAQFVFTVTPNTVWLLRKQDLSMVIVETYDTKSKAKEVCLNLNKESGISEEEARALAVLCKKGNDNSVKLLYETVKNATEKEFGEMISTLMLTWYEAGYKQRR